VGIVKAIEAHPGKPALGPPQPQYVRALGAALFTCRLQQEGVASC
jgi:activator of 2-hydroxyglutaryl-CoA dehydratase